MLPVQGFTGTCIRATCFRQDELHQLMRSLRLFDAMFPLQPGCEIIQRMLSSQAHAIMCLLRLCSPCPLALLHVSAEGCMQAALCWLNKRSTVMYGRNPQHICAPERHMTIFLHSWCFPLE